MSERHPPDLLPTKESDESEALWSQFLELSRQLQARLHEVTSAFVKATVAQPKR